MRRSMPLFSLLFCMPGFAVGADHGVVYREEGRFGGWPANHGVWSWGDEILVGFSRGWYKDMGPSHHIDRDKPEEHVLARSLDGGATWRLEKPNDSGVLIGTKGMRHGRVPQGTPEAPPEPLKAAIDFKHPDFAMTVRMGDVNAGSSRFYYSYDRGKSWFGPYSLPLFDQKGVMARTDYIVDESNTCTLFVTASKSDAKEGRPICVRTTDGGLTWKLVGMIGPEPAGYAIMPASVRLGPGRLFTTIRAREGKKSWIDAYASDDDGKTWTKVATPEADAGEGNPPSLLRLRDDRLCLIYGYRADPFGIRARFSSDRGRTWTAPVVLRSDAGGRDIGYVRSVQRPDGKVVAIYYYHEKENPTRFIAFTIFDPGKF